MISPGFIQPFDHYEVNTASKFASIFLESAQLPAKRMCNKFYNNALRQLQRNSDEVVKVLANIYKRQGWGTQSLGRVIGSLL